MKVFHKFFFEFLSQMYDFPNLLGKTVSRNFAKNFQCFSHKIICFNFQCFSFAQVEMGKSLSLIQCILHKNRNYRKIENVFPSHSVCFGKIREHFMRKYFILYFILFDHRRLQKLKMKIRCV